MSEFRVIQANIPPDFVDLGIGQPGFDLLPLDLLHRAANERLAEPDPAFLNYGYELGDGRFRHALADFLTPHYGTAVDPETIMVTTGASQALDLICTLFTQAGDTVFVEEPSYFLALRIFADHGLNVVGIPIDAGGLRIDGLQDALQRHQPAFLYTIPVFQNPTGTTLRPERRQALLALAEAHDFFVVADEVYQLLHYTGTPPPPLATLIGSERVLSVSSFSKILAPGLRLGWVQAAPVLLARLTGAGMLDSGGGLNPFTSNVVRVALERGWQADHLATLRRAYARRIALMVDALREHVPDVVHFTPPPGGFFFWLTLPPGVETAVLQQLAQKHRVGFQPGHKFSGNGGQLNRLRLSFAFYDEAKLVQGVQRLGAAVRDVMD